MKLLEQQPRTRVVFGAGVLHRLGTLAAELGFRRTLLVTDHGLVAAGHFDHAAKLLQTAGISVAGFHNFPPNPDTHAIEAGRDAARDAEVDSIIGLGGGSSMDCAKGINFLLTNGGRVQDYVGYGKATQPMLPMIGIPTTTGTGSEAQSYALVSDAETHLKMACGDPKAAFRVAILDPELAVSQPDSVRAMTGYDAISHAVETFVTTRRNPASEAFSREAWRLLSSHYERALAEPSNVEVQGAMMLGAHYAGAAIEHSMLGATHACANPLTARYGTIHGAAIALLLAHVVRWNSTVADAHYAELAAATNGSPHGAAEALAARLEQFAVAGRLATRLSAAGIPREHLPALAQAAAQQWTGQFNPRPFNAAGALEVYQSAY
jgi:alcohol dehydrogenase